MNTVIRRTVTFHQESADAPKTWHGWIKYEKESCRARTKMGIFRCNSRALSKPPAPSLSPRLMQVKATRISPTKVHCRRTKSEECRYPLRFKTEVIQSDCCICKLLYSFKSCEGDRDQSKMVTGGRSVVDQRKVTVVLACLADPQQTSVRRVRWRACQRLSAANYW